MAWPPPELLERARLIARGELQPPPTRDASTVLLLRDREGADGTHVEVLLMRRVASMAFAAGAVVFPGGSVDPDDLTAQVDLPAGYTDMLAADEPLSRALVCAAVRETFEEAGILLVRGQAPEQWAEERRALDARETSLAAVLARHGLTLDADVVRPWARWVTPEPEVKRFDTRFFVAAMPDGQRAAGDDAGGEADGSAWMRPQHAIDGFHAGQLTMLPPTIATLQEIAPYATVADVLTATETRAVTVVEPRIEVADDGTFRFIRPGFDDIVL
ncbi:MAG TPA: NUDIX hydrolase [Mycobacteriales bacterium]|nr:NUDIX hydrolase [Mycobacteriales bacterium]